MALKKEIHMRKKIQLNFVPILFLFLVGTVSAQQRVVEESLVYDDPTVAKPGKWLFGVAAGAYYSNATTAGSDTNGNTVYAPQQMTQPQASAYIGYQDVTFLIRYQKEKSTSNYPGNTANMSGDIYIADLRWLITDLRSKYFVPYVMASYAKYTENTTFSYVNGSGLRQTGKNWGDGPGLGIGGIFPITEKYGLRADARQFNLKANSSSNMWSAFNTSGRKVEYRRFQLVGYYNITDNINFQLGGDATNVNGFANSTTYGFFSQIGYSF
jgi:hypothetical protein